MNKKKKFVLGIIAIIILCATTFDQYMKATWDHHIVGQMWDRKTIESTGAASSIKRVGLDKWSNLTPQERKKYKYLYPEKLEIEKQGGKYIWISNGNKELVKTIEFNQHLKSIIFTEPETDTRIEILVNKYLSFGCTKASWAGNAGIYFQLNSGDVLKYGFDTSVYQGLPMYISCGE